MDIQPVLSSEQIGQLRDRWTTSAGQDLVNLLIKIWKTDGKGWREVAAEIPKTEVEPAHPDFLVDLRGLSLTNEKLPGLMLPYVDLSHARFHLCNLEEICLQGSKLSWAAFSKCNLKQSDLLQVMADNSVFDRCTMNDAVLIDGDFRSALFRGVRLPRALMDGADLRESRIENVVLDNAKMLNTQFPSGFDPKQSNPPSNNGFVPF